MHIKKNKFDPSDKKNFEFEIVSISDETFFTVSVFFQLIHFFQNFVRIFDSPADAAAAAAAAAVKSVPYPVARVILRKKAPQQKKNNAEQLTE